jgi:hypothetical protein
LHGLKLGDQDGGTNEAIFERCRNEIQIIPVLNDEVDPDLFFERGGEERNIGKEAC